jgi:hypothetical protein
MSTGSGTGTAFQSCPGSGAEVGANTALSNLSTVAINDMLLPGASNTIDIGSTTRAFRNLYLGGTITAAGAINGITLTSTALQSAGALSLSAGGTNQAITVAGSGSGDSYQKRYEALRQTFSEAGELLAQWGMTEMLPPNIIKIVIHEWELIIASGQSANGQKQEDLEKLKENLERLGILSDE